LIAKQNRARRVAARPSVSSDIEPLSGGKIQRIAGLHTERRVPGVDVPDDPVAPVEMQRVEIGKQARSGRPLA
jgi:hypothetical protein